MIKLVCLTCGAEWHTANTQPGQTCETCGGDLLPAACVACPCNGRCDLCGQK